jgi:hypothetical protein
LIPKAMRNSSLFRRMTKGLWVSEAATSAETAVPAPALLATAITSAKWILFMSISV